MAVFPHYKELLPYEVVFFDLDNTIYPYDPAHQSALTVVLNDFGKKYGLDEMRVKELYKESRGVINKRLHGQASSHSRLLYFKEMLHRLGEFRTYSDALLFEKIYWQHFLKVMTIDKDAIRLIRRLHKANKPMGIITDLTTQIQLQKMKRLKIEQYFSHIITSEETGIEKPDPVIFQFALDKFAVKAEQAVMIGDNIKTDKGSEDIGIKCFII